MHSYTTACISMDMTWQEKTTFKQSIIENSMWSIEWHHCLWPLVTLKVTFAVWNLSVSHTSRKYSMYYLQCLHMDQKVNMVCNFNYLFETKDLSRSQPIAYTVNVVRRRKLCHASHCYYRPLIGSYTCLSNRSNSSDLESSSRLFPTASLSIWFLRTALQQLTRFNWHRMSHSPYVAAELLVWGSICMLCQPAIHSVVLTKNTPHNAWDGYDSALCVCHAVNAGSFWFTLMQGRSSNCQCKL